MKQIAIKYGVWMFSGFTLFFLAMHFLGLSQNYDLRIFNAVIHMFLIYLAIKEFFGTKANTGDINYISGVSVGMVTSMVGVVMFTIFMTLFLTASPDFMAKIQKDFAFGEHLSPFSASVFIFVEGVATSLIGSYIITRIIESKWVKAKG